MRVLRVVCAAVLAAAVVAPAPAYADDLDDRRRQVDRALDEQYDDLDESSAAVRRAAAALRAVAVALPRAEQRLAAAEGQLSGASARAEGARAALAAATAEVGRAELLLTQAQMRLGASRQAVADLARAAYVFGPGSYLGVLLEAESPADLVERRQTIQVLFDQTDERVEAAGQARADVTSRRGALLLRQDRVAAAQRSAADALARVQALTEQAREATREVERQLAARRGALAAAERERADDLRRYRTLQAESRRLAELIRRNAGRGRAPKISNLLWPTDGPVTSGFGWRVHPIYGYRRFHAGIDIGAPSGQPIVAVLAGTVVHAGPLGTYGNLVVVDHGNGFATAYAHQSKVLVVEGQRVGKGYRIGLVGSTGASTGPHLHFETRVGGEPVDPMRYY